MRYRFKIAFAILLGATMVWALACYLHVQAYNRYVQKVTGRYKPVWLWGLSIVLFPVGCYIGIAWIGFCVKLINLRKRG